MNKKILIIEDEIILIEAIRERLARFGYDIETAYDGEKGLANIKAQKPDLLILDLLLPGIDGYEVLERLKKEKINLPIIIISNSGQKVEIEKAKELGASDFIVKVNFSLDDVEKRVRNILE